MMAVKKDRRLFETFSEKGFYLGEFRGRTLAVAAAAEDLRAPAPLKAVLKELAANGTRFVLISNDFGSLESLSDSRIVPVQVDRLEGTVWHALREAQWIGIAVEGGAGFARACREVALRLGVTKLVWIDRDGGLLDAEGRRLSFVHLDELRSIQRSLPARDERRASVLGEIESILEAGLPAVNLCSLEGLPDELFTYAGSGTLFSRERYVVVRRLGIDDYDAADDLIARGVAEGYLAPRSPAAIERVLANGFGAFVEGRHLAGIGALLHWEKQRAAEIASLYTLTRFVGEGIGGHLVAFACDRARELDCVTVYAVTTSVRVARFFERMGFERVAADEIPAEKWEGYDEERRARAICLRRRL